MRHLRQKLAYHYKNGGGVDLLRGAVRLFRRTLWSECQWLLYERVLEDLPPGAVETVVRRELGFLDLVNLGYFKARAFPDAIKRRLDERNVCHGFCEGDRLATIGWTSPDFLELDDDLRLPCPGAVGLFDFYTYEAFRSRGHYTSALRCLTGLARKGGFTRAYIAVDPKNLPSIRGIERAGFNRVMRITRRRRFGVRNIIQEEMGNGAL